MDGAPPPDVAAALVQNRHEVICAGEHRDIGPVAVEIAQQALVDLTRDGGNIQRRSTPNRPFRAPELWVRVSCGPS